MSSQNKDIRFGLVGCGKIAKRHATLLAENWVAGTQLGAVCDPVEERAKSLGEGYGVKYYTSPEAMMADGQIDAITIMTPSGMHADQVVQLATYGKPIVVEKPMALILDDADRMIEACDLHGCKLFVVKQNRFNLPVVKLREAMQKGRLGKLVLGTVRVRWCRRQDYYAEAPWRGSWAYDGGVLANQAIHHIDLLQWLMGPVDTVFAYAKTALVDIEAEDTAVVTLKFRNGALGIIEATTATRPKDLEGSISILGEKGNVEIGGFAMNELKRWNFEETNVEDQRVFDEFGANPKNTFSYAHAKYYEHVVDCINNNKEQLVDGLAGRRSLELIAAIYESIETARQVNLRFIPEKCRLGIKN